MSESVCEVGLKKKKKKDSENGPGPGDAAKYAYVSPTSRSASTLGRGPRPWGRRGQWGAPSRTLCTHLTNPRRVRRGGGPAFRGRGGGRSHLPGAPGFFLLSRPGLPRLPRLVSAGPEARGPTGTRRLRSRRAARPRPGSSAAECKERLPAGLALAESRPEPPQVFPRPPTSQRGNSGPWRAGVWRDLGREAGRTAAAAQSRAPRVCLNVRAAGLILAAPGERRLLPSLLPLSPGER